MSKNQRNPRPRKGVTLIELMITLVIITMLMTAVVFTMSSYIPKQRLLDTVERIEQDMNRAQFEATSRIQWTCLEIRTDGTISITLDVDGNHGAVGACGNAGDIELDTNTMSSGVSLVLGCANTFQGDEPIWFDTAGVPRECNTAAGICSAQSYQVVISNPDLSSSARAREIELSSSGLIQSITFGEQGFDTSAWAKTSKIGSGGWRIVLCCKLLSKSIPSRRTLAV
ncbi:MAG: type II secretion system protein [Bdellovibrionota bacterium]